MAGGAVFNGAPEIGTREEPSNDDDTSGASVIVLAMYVTTAGAGLP